VRYPVKSMAGIATASASLGWHGLDGDRRFAFRRVGAGGGMPWLTASRLPELVLYRPAGLDESAGEPLPTHVRTPAGACVELRGPELQAEIAGRFGSGVELMRLDHGIFDEAPVSVISLATIAGIGREAGLELDLGDERVLKEVALFADRCDITEELTRLRSHLDQFVALLKSGGEIGRKSEFILQEIGREVHTIGSKANDLEISKNVIELKNELERIREQIANVE